MSTEFNKPASRVEAILQNMLGDTNVLEKPASRVEALLLAIKNLMINVEEAIEELRRNFPKRVLVTELPEEGDVNTWYFVGPKEDEQENIYYEQWIYVIDSQDIGVWRSVGSTASIDLSDYYTKDETDELFSQKADIDGIYNKMVVGFADEADESAHASLADQAVGIYTDREIDDASDACPPITFGTTGGNAEVESGFMRFEELRGHSMVWNQLVQNGNFESASNWIAGNCTLSFANNTVTVTASSGYETNFQLRQTMTKPAIYGHKVLYVYTARKTYEGSLSVRIRYPATSSYVTLTNSFNLIRQIEIVTSESSGLDIFWVQGLEGTSGAKFEVKNVIFSDLTLMFGAGNEPTSVDDPRVHWIVEQATKNPAYNTGTLLSSQSDSLISVERNQWDEEWVVGSFQDGVFTPDPTKYVCSKNLIHVLPNTEYYLGGFSQTTSILYYDANGNYSSWERINSSSSRTFTTPANTRFIMFQVSGEYGTTYKNDICIYINWDTPNLPYEPYRKQTITLPNIELRSAGSAYDVAYQQGGGKRRIGVVDLGTLSWERFGASYPNTFIANMTGQNEDDSVVRSIIGAPYNYSSNAATEMPDKTYRLANSLRIHDSAYSDAATFKAAMSGVMLYYELAEETDIPLSENPGWEEYVLVDNFGTLQFTSEQALQVPQAYFIRYTVNLVEFLDSLGERAGFNANNIALKSDTSIVYQHKLTLHISKNGYNPDFLFSGDFIIYNDVSTAYTSWSDIIDVTDLTNSVLKGISQVYNGYKYDENSSYDMDQYVAFANYVVNQRSGMESYMILITEELETVSVPVLIYDGETEYPFFDPDYEYSIIDIVTKL